MSRSLEMPSPVGTRLSLREEALVRIREAIVLGQLPPGHLSSEQAIADALQISRTPIREALLQLSAEGLVEFLPNRGVRVTVPHADHLAKVYELRASIEGYCAMRLAQRADHEQVASALDKFLEEQRDIIAANDHRTWVRANMEFHIAIVQACGNDLMVDAVRSVSSHGMRIGHAINDTVHFRMNQSLDEHTEIVDSIRAGQSERAFRSVEMHLSVTTSLMRKQMAS